MSKNILLILSKHNGKIRTIFQSNIILIAFFFLVTFQTYEVYGQSNSFDSKLDSVIYKINRLAPDQMQDQTRVVIDGGGTLATIEIISLVETIQTSIITPQGQIITPQNINIIGGSFTQAGGIPAGEGNPLIILPQVTGNFHYIYQFPIAAGEGEYTIKFQAPAGLNRQLPILTKIEWDSDIVVKLFPTKTSSIVGKPMVISAALFRAQSPVVDANVQLFVRAPSHLRSTISLLDNGDGESDDRIGDGIYSTLFTPTEVGSYSLIAVINGKVGKKSFTRNSLASIFTRAAASQFSGTLTNQGVDDNADGLFDKIRFRLGTQTVLAGQYQAFVELRTASGRTIIGNGAANLASGTGEIIADIPASNVLKANENGPYTIASIRLNQIIDTEGSQEVDHRINLGQTPPYQLSQFQRPPLILTGVFSENGIDTNSNGKFDILRVSVQVDVLTPGLYDWNMKIANSESQDISFASARGNLTSGLNNIVVDFNGAQIRRSESNGPYSITDLLLFGPKSIVATEVGQTRAYSFTEFEEGGPNVSIGLSPTNAGNLRIGQPHTVNVTVNQGSAPVASRIVTLRILSGPNSGLLTSKTTNAAGKASFTYTGNVVGTDTLRASVTVDDFLFNSATATATWIDNSAPLCTQASPSINLISPPDNRFVAVNILGLSDPDNDPVIVSVVSIRQDEPTNHLGANPNTPDAMVQNGAVSLKAERIFGTVQVNGTTYTGNGRVYHIAFTATDGRGGQCGGTVKVGVPHVITATPVDGGPLFDSTSP